MLYRSPYIQVCQAECGADGRGDMSACTDVWARRRCLHAVGLSISLFALVIANSRYEYELLTLILAPTAPTTLRLKALFLSIEPPVRFGLGARDGCPTPQKWSEKASSDRPRMPDPLSSRDKMSPIGLGCPTHQPFKWSSTDYLAMFTPFRFHTRIIWKGNLFDFAIIFTRLTARSCTGKRGKV